MSMVLRYNAIRFVRWLVKYLPGTVVFGAVATALDLKDKIAKLHPVLAPYAIYLVVLYPIIGVVVVSIWDFLVDRLKRVIDRLDKAGIEREFQQFRVLLRKSKLHVNPYLRKTISYRLTFEIQEFMTPMLTSGGFVIRSFEKIEYARMVLSRMWKFPFKGDYYISLSNYDYWSVKPINREVLVRSSMEMHGRGVNTTRVILVSRRKLLEGRRDLPTGGTEDVILDVDQELAELVSYFDKAHKTLSKQDFPYQVFFHFIPHFDYENIKTVPFALVMDPSMRHFMYATTDMHRTTSTSDASVTLSFYSTQLKRRGRKSAKNAHDCFKLYTEAGERLLRDESVHAPKLRKWIDHFMKYYSPVLQKYKADGTKNIAYVGPLWDIEDFKTRFPNRFK